MNLEPLQDKTLLYVEDDQSIVNSFIPIFNKIFKTVHCAHNGEDGYYLFKKNKDSIDFVITDIKMPRMNGLDMCHAIKQIDPTIVCIVTTAHAEQEYISKADEIGVYEYIKKPLNVQELILKILKVSQN